MTRATNPLVDPSSPSFEELKHLSASEIQAQIKRLNSKAGQLKMDLHDLAEGLPTDFELLPDLAARTYDLFALLHTLKQHLKTLEISP
ncbi:CCE_0567 family metalloprotein [Thermostichus vulcanus]|uniref:Uncharacterized protein n=1 Tax=Thermostichus vulcanus str. 'Rupite' TaxID=2813851 RepID=A0ABT0C7Z4_THEVL|nr:CCE_0567 family metalloprotein [Thermostichus vulcanus]MCJ2541911.1 hypothetical protein [Thermostichus vulcanus str. 'Rupite']